MQGDYRVNNFSSTWIWKPLELDLTSGLGDPIWPCQPPAEAPQLSKQGQPSGAVTVETRL